MKRTASSLALAAIVAGTMIGPVQAQQLNQLTRAAGVALALKDGVKAQAAVADRVEFTSNFDNGQTQGMNVMRDTNAALAFQVASADTVTMDQNNSQNGVQGMNVIQNTPTLGVLQVSKVRVLKASSTGGFNNTQGMNVIIGNGS